MSASEESHPDVDEENALTSHIVTPNAPLPCTLVPGDLKIDFGTHLMYLNISWKKRTLGSSDDSEKEKITARAMQRSKGCYGLDLQYPPGVASGSLLLSAGGICLSSDERAPPEFDHLKITIRPRGRDVSAPSSPWVTVLPSPPAQPSEPVRHRETSRFRTIADLRDPDDDEIEEAERSRLEAERARAEAFSVYARPRAMLESIFPREPSPLPGPRLTMDDFALFSYGVHARRFDVCNTSLGRVLMFTRFPDLGGVVQGGSGRTGVVLMHQARNPYDPSVVQITSDDGHVAVSSWPPPLPETKDQPLDILAFNGRFQAVANQSVCQFSALYRYGSRSEGQSRQTQLLGWNR